MFLLVMKILSCNVEIIKSLFSITETTIIKITDTNDEILLFLLAFFLHLF